jgi:glyoxylase-like metal-dependent hydrolase (beta-lactamase superfamily II)
VVHQITPIALGKGNFGVNAYLVRTDAGFVLVDTGMRNHRPALVEALRDAGVTPEKLKLILITHGDPDHIGNAAYLRDAYSAPIAMHVGDIGMSRDGDFFAGRKGPNAIIKKLLGLTFTLPVADRFVPDVELAEGINLERYGLGGVRVLKTSGHSAGSVALLFEDGSLIAGDLIENRKNPALGSIMDDADAGMRSVARLAELDPGLVYPGHGRPFGFHELGRGVE